MLMKRNENHVINQLLEYQARDQETAELDKLLLRLHENPPLTQYLYNLGKNGENTELDFYGLPDKAIEGVKRLIGVPAEVFCYDVAGSPHIGFRFNLKQAAAASDENSRQVS